MSELVHLDTPASTHGHAAAAPAHEHGWCLESRHATSQGEVRYVRCLGCGIRRVDLAHQAGVPPVALSRATRR